MIDWRYSGNISKRFAYKAICCALAFFLAIMMFQAESISYLRNKAVNNVSAAIESAISLAQFKANQLGNSTSVSAASESSGTTASSEAVVSQNSQTSSDDSEYFKSIANGLAANSSNVTATSQDNESSSVSFDLGSFFGSLFGVQKAFADEYDGPADGYDYTGSEYNDGDYWWSDENNKANIELDTNNADVYLSGEGTEANPYRVSNYQEFKAALKGSGNYIVLLNDITVPGYYKTVVNGNVESGGRIIDTFSKNLDGQGYTIKSQSSLHNSFFDTISNATIKNVTFNFNIDWTQILSKLKLSSCPDTMGLLATYSKGNVEFSDVTVEGYLENRADDSGYDRKRMGSIIGVVSDGNLTFNNVVCKAGISVSGTAIHHAGGFIGNSTGGNITFNSCNYEGTVSTLTESSEIANMFIKSAQEFTMAVIKLCIDCLITITVDKIYQESKKRKSKSPTINTGDLDDITDKAGEKAGSDVKKMAQKNTYKSLADGNNTVEVDLNDKVKITLDDNCPLKQYESEINNEFNSKLTNLDNDINQQNKIIADCDDTLNTRDSNLKDLYYEKNQIKEPIRSDYPDTEDGNTHYDHDKRSYEEGLNNFIVSDGDAQKIKDIKLFKDAETNKKEAIKNRDYSQAQKTVFKEAIERCFNSPNQKCSLLVFMQNCWINLSNNDGVDLIDPLGLIDSLIANSTTHNGSLSLGSFIIDDAVGSLIDLFQNDEWNTVSGLSSYDDAKQYLKKNKAGKTYLGEIAYGKRVMLDLLGNVAGKLIQSLPFLNLCFGVSTAFEFSHSGAKHNDYGFLGAFGKIIQSSNNFWNSAFNSNNTSGWRFGGALLGGLEWLKNYADMLYLGFWDQKFTKMYSNLIGVVSANKNMLSKQKSSIGGSVSGIIKNELKKQVKEVLPQIQSYASVDPEFSQVAGVDFYNAIMRLDTSNIDENSDIFKSLEVFCGELIGERIYATIGDQGLFQNIYNGINFTDGKYTEYIDFLAMQGRLLYSGKEPVALVFSTDRLDELRNSDEYKQLVKAIDAAIASDSHEQIARAYADLGGLYCQFSTKDEKNDDVLNKAFSIQDIEIALNYARIFRDASLDLYYDERNATSTYRNSYGEEITVKGTPRLRNFINSAYTDTVSWSEFLADWAPDLYNRFHDKMLEENIWEESYKDNEKELLIKHFFNTYVTYSRDFELSSYLLSTRSALYVDNSELYAVDFLFTYDQMKEGLSDEEINKLLPDGDRTWKSTMDVPGFKYPLYNGAIQEASFFDSRESISEVLNYDFDEAEALKSFTDTYNSSYENKAKEASQGVEALSVGDGIQNMFTGLASSLKTCATSLPASGIIETSWVGTSHYNAYGGGYIGQNSGAKITFNDSIVSGNIVGGTFAGGFIGQNSSGNVEFNSTSFQGSVGTSDALDIHDWNDIGKDKCQRESVGWATSAGGFIGEVNSGNIVVNKCVTSGVCASRQNAGGIIGYLYGGNLRVDASGIIAGISAPYSCGGVVGELKGSVSITDSYLACTYDNNSNCDVTNNTTEKGLSFISIYAPTRATTTEQVNRDIGVLFGSGNGFYSCSNIYYLNQGYKLKGNDGDVAGHSSSSCYPVALDDFQSGSVTYKLNGSKDFQNEGDEDIKTTCKFSQVINDFSLGTRGYLPMPTTTALVYKDLLSASPNAYTNYNPRKIQTHTITINKQNSQIGPDVLSINVKHGDSFTFSVSPNSGYKIDNVSLLDDAGVSTILEPVGLSGDTQTFTIENIKDSATVNVKNSTLDEKEPKGTGRIGDPYLIYTATELLWFNNHMKENPNVNAQVKLMADIDFSAFSWYPLFSEKVGGGYSGYFDGNNHTISGLSIPKQGSNICAFFKGLEGDLTREYGHDWVIISDGSSTVMPNSGNNEIKLTDENIEDLIEHNANVKLVVNPESASKSGAYAHNTYISALLRGKIIDTYKDSANNDVSITSDNDVFKTIQQLSSNKAESDNTIYLGFVDKSSFDKKGSDYSDFKQIKRLVTESGVVKNLTLSGSFGDAALTYSARNAKIENVKIAEGSSVSASDAEARCAGGFVAAGSGSLEIINCENNASVSFNSNKINNFIAAGGLVGKFVNEDWLFEHIPSSDKNNSISLKIVNSKNNGSVTASSGAWSIMDDDSGADDYCYAGGIVGAVTGDNNATNIDLLIEGCENTGSVADNDSSLAFLGGVAGVVDNFKTGNFVVNNTINKGNIGYDSSGRNVSCADSGGILGKLIDSNVNYKIYNSTNYGNVWAGTGSKEGISENTINIVSTAVSSILGLSVTLVSAYIGVKNGSKGSSGGSSGDGSPANLAKSATVDFGLGFAINLIVDIIICVLYGLADRTGDTYAGLLVGQFENDTKIDVKNCLVTGIAESEKHKLSDENFNIKQMLFANQENKATLSQVYYLNNGVSGSANCTEVYKNELESGHLAYVMNNNSKYGINGYYASYGQNIDTKESGYDAQNMPDLQQFNSKDVFIRHDWETEPYFYTNDESVTKENSTKPKDSIVKINYNFVDDSEGFVDGPEYANITKSGASQKIAFTVGGKEGYEFDYVSLGGNNNNVRIVDSKNASSSDGVKTSSYDSYLKSFVIDVSYLGNNKFKINDGSKEFEFSSSNDMVNLDFNVAFNSTDKPEFDANNNYYKVANARQLKWFAQKVNKCQGNLQSVDCDLETLNVKLVDNIDIPNNNFWNLTIGGSWKNAKTNDSNLWSQSWGYGGTFDGKIDNSDAYYTITNLSPNPIFGNLSDNADIKNLNISKSITDYTGYSFGGIALAGSSSGDNVHISNINTNGYVSGSIEIFGSILGKVTSGNATIENCDNRISFTGNATTIGGFVDTCQSGNLELNNSNNYALFADQSKKASVGGIVGNVGCIVKDGNEVKVDSCGNFGFLSGNKAGGIVGQMSSTNTNATISRCLNIGAPVGTIIAGGIVGCADDLLGGNSTYKLYGNQNEAVITAGEDAGGLIGNVNLTTSKIYFDRCINVSDAILGQKHSGGLVGVLKTNAGGILNNSGSFTKEISGSESWGDAVGQIGDNYLCSNVSSGSINYSTNNILLNNLYVSNGTKSDSNYTSGSSLIIGNHATSSGDSSKTGNYFWVENTNILQTGELAYKMNNNFAKAPYYDTDGLNNINVTQVIDYEGLEVDNAPKIARSEDNVRVYKVGSSYSNYQDVNNTLCTVRALSTSLDNSYDHNFILSKDEGFNVVNLSPYAQYRLSGLTVGDNNFSKKALDKLADNNYRLNLDDYVYDYDEEDSEIHGSCYTIENDDKVLQRTYVYYSFTDDEPCDFDSEKNAYIINSEENLLWYQRLVNSSKDKANANAILNNDLDMSFEPWVGLGTKSDNPYKGTFDGNNYTINGINNGEASNSSCCAFVDYALTATIKNLNLSVDIDAPANAAGVINWSRSSTVENVTVDGSLRAETNDVGGIVRCISNSSSTNKNYAQYGTDFKCATIIKNCTFNGIIDSKYSTGGIVGAIDSPSKAVIDSCKCLGTASISERGSGTYANYAGIVGNIASGNGLNVLIQHCVNYVNLSGNENVGGIVGHYNAGNNSKLNIYACTNYGSLNGSSTAGGMVAWYGNGNKSTSTHTNLVIENCMNYGNITSETLNGYAGGMVGIQDTGVKYGYLTINRCGSSATILANQKDGNAAGGMVGLVSGAYNTFINNSFVTGYVCAKKNGREGSCVGDVCDSRTGVNPKIYNFRYLNSMVDGADSNNLTGGNDHIHKDGNISTFSNEQLKNGEVAYWLKSNDDNKNLTSSFIIHNINDANNPECGWGQVIDNIRLGEIDSMPRPTAGNANVYSVSTNPTKDNYPSPIYSNNNSSEGIYFDSYVKNINKTNVKAYKVFTQDSDGSLYELNNRFSTIMDEDRDNLYTQSRFYVMPEDGFYIDKIILNGAELSANKITYSMLISGKTNYVEVQCSYLHQPDDYVVISTSPKIANCTINSYAELLWLQNEIKSYNADTGDQLNVNIGTDIVYQNGNALNSWKPIGASDHPYVGTFNGNSHNITGLICNQSSGAAMFAYTKNAKITGFNLENIDFISAKGTVSGVVENAAGTTVSNVNVNGQISARGDRTAGVVGHFYGVGNSSFSNIIDTCSANLTIADPSGNDNIVGGILGTVNASDTPVTVKNCMNLSALHSNREGDGFVLMKDNDFCGGIIGCIQKTNSTINVYDCINLGGVKGDTAGGIVSRIDQNGSSTVNILNCENYGSINGDYFSGIIGRIHSVDGDSTNINIKWCTNYGYVGVTGKKVFAAGGLIGQLNDSNANVKVQYSINKGTINAGSSDITESWATDGGMALYTTTISAFTSVIGTGLAIAGIVSAASGPAAPIVMAVVGLVTSLIGFANWIMNTITAKKTNRWDMNTYGGCLVGEISEKADLELYNCINYGTSYSIAESARHESYCNDFVGSDQNTKKGGHPKSYNWSGHSYTIGGETSGDSENKAIKRTWDSLKSGQVAYEMEEYDLANKKNFIDHSSTSDEFLDAQLKQMNIYDNWNVYFGQNLDKYTVRDEQGNIQQKMSDPGFKCTSNEFKVYKHVFTYDTSTEKNLTKTIYSNYSSKDQFINIKDYINISADESKWYIKDDYKYPEPLAKEFDSTLIGGRSFEATIPNYESQYSWGSFNRSYDLLLDETAQIRLLKSPHNNNKYSIEDVHLNMITKIDKFTPAYENEGISVVTNWKDVPNLEGYNDYIYSTQDVFMQKDTSGNVVTTQLYCTSDGLSLNPSDSTTTFDNCFETKDLTDNVDKSAGFNIRQITPKYGETTAVYVSYADGSSEKLYNPVWSQTYLVLDGQIIPIALQLINYDYRVFMDVSGEVEVFINTTPNTKDSLIIDPETNDAVAQKTYSVELDISNHGTHTHDMGGDGVLKRYTNWDNPDKLPTENGYYYLNTDVKLTNDALISNNHIVNLCLNGHKIDVDGHRISIDSGALNICDCNDSDSWYVPEDIDLTNGTKDYKFIDSSSAWRYDKVIKGGIIYNSAGFSDVPLPMFEERYGGAINIYSGNIDIANSDCGVALTLNHTDMRNGEDGSSPILYINANVVGEAIHGVINAGDTMFTKEIDTPLHLDYSSAFIKFGDDYSYEKDMYSEAADVYLNSCVSKGNIEFESVEGPKTPILVTTYDNYNMPNNLPVRLTKNFDNLVKQGVDASKFIAVTGLDNYELAYTDNNEIALANKDNVETVFVNADDTFAKTYPVGNVSTDQTGYKELRYVIGSHPYIHYSMTNGTINEFSYSYTAKKAYKTYPVGAKVVTENAEILPANMYVGEHKFNNPVCQTYSSAEDGISNLPVRNKIDCTYQTYSDELNNIHTWEAGNSTIDWLPVYSANDFIRDSEKYVKQSDGSYTGDPNYELMYERYTDGSYVTVDGNLVKVYKTDENGDYILDNGENVQASEKYMRGSFDSKPIGYKLQNDVTLDESWYAPAGRIALDLNGHTLNIKTKLDNTQNVIIIEESNTILSVTDSKGAGTITGTNVMPTEYYLYLQRAGAVVVNDGVFNFDAGSIKGNTSRDILGGAAITIGENGKTYIGKKASICENTLSGDTGFGNSCFAAAIASEGYLYNEGNIFNNTSNYYSASAVYSQSGTFINKGKIYDNVAKRDTQNKGRDSFGTVFINGGASFENYGSIYNNTADFKVSAVVNRGDFGIGGLSAIYGNKCIIESEDSVLDITTSNPVNILSELTNNDSTIDYASVMDVGKTGVTVTNGWPNAFSSINDFFKAPEYADYVYARNNYDEVSSAYEDSLFKLRFVSVGDDDAVSNICSDDYYTSYAHFPVTVYPGGGSKLYRATFNDTDVSKVRVGDTTFTPYIQKWDDVEDYVVTAYFDKNLIPWTDKFSLPTEPGHYYLTDNVYLDNLVNATKLNDEVRIDLNGYKIESADNDTKVIYASDKSVDKYVFEDFYIDENVEFSDEAYKNQLMASNVLKVVPLDDDQTLWEESDTLPEKSGSYMLTRNVLQSQILDVTQTKDAIEVDLNGYNVLKNPNVWDSYIITNDDNKGYVFSNWKDSSFDNGEFITALKNGDMYASAKGDLEVWTSDNSLPTEPGNYICTSDILLDGICDLTKLKENITIDLYGHYFEALNDRSYILGTCDNIGKSNLEHLFVLTDTSSRKCGKSYYLLKDYGEIVLEEGENNVWTDETKLPTEPGKYKLDTNIALKNFVDYQNVSGQVEIDLNGHTIKRFIEKDQWDNIIGPCEYGEIYELTGKRVLVFTDSTNRSFNAERYRGQLETDGVLHYSNEPVTPWFDSQNVPLYSGSFKLFTDITFFDSSLSYRSDFTPPAKIDLNGHAIDCVLPNVGSIKFYNVPNASLEFSDSKNSNFDSAKYWKEMCDKQYITGKTRSFSNGLMMMGNPMANSDGYKNISNADSMPVEAGKYRLQRDIELDSAWNVPAGNVTLDLNGFNMTVTNENENVIFMDNDSTNLTIEDSQHEGNNEGSRNYLIMNEDGTYRISPIAEQGYVSVEVNGGIIGGAKFNKYGQSGAIYVNKGTLTMNGGTVAGNIQNNEDKFLFFENANGGGAAAIASMPGTKVTLSENVSICYNEARSLQSSENYAVAGIMTMGELVSAANINDNIAYNHGVAGVAVVNDTASFTNTGFIANNEAVGKSVAGIGSFNENKEYGYNIKVMNKGTISANYASESSIAAVDSYDTFYNSGVITANKSLDSSSYAGLYLYKEITLDGENQIYENINKNTYAPEDMAFLSENMVDYVYTETNAQAKSLINLGPNYRPDTTLKASVNDENKMAPTSLTYIHVKDFEENENPIVIVSSSDNNKATSRYSAQDMNKLISSANSEYGMCLSANGDWVLNKKENISYMHVTATDGGIVDCLGDTAIASGQDINIPVTVKANPGYKIHSINITTEEETKNVELNDSNNKEYKFGFDDSSYCKSVSVDFAKDATLFVPEAAVEESVYQNWNSGTALPSVAGSYKLTRDVVLTHTWLVPQGATQLDLNGFNVTIKSDETIATLQDFDSALDVLDSRKTTVNKFKKDEKTGKYVKDVNGDIEVLGGTFYGGNGEQGGAFSLAPNAYLALHEINLIGNNAKLGGAVFNAGRLVISGNAIVAGNTAEVAGAIYNYKETSFINTGQIFDNTATQQAGGVYTEYLITLATTSRITNNVVLAEDPNDKERLVPVFNDVVLEKLSNKRSYDKGSAIYIPEDIQDKESVTYITCLDAKVGNVFGKSWFTNPFINDIKKGLYVTDEHGVYNIKLDVNSGTFVSSSIAWDSGL